MLSKPAAERYAIRLLFVILILAGWSTMASFLFAYGIGHPELLAFPYVQWFDGLSVVRSMLWWPHTFASGVQHPLLWLVLSGVGPSALVLAVLVACGVLRLRQRTVQPDKLRQSLYGASGWADAGEQRANGVRQSARLP
jgi:hypothetical protein